MTSKSVDAVRVHRVVDAIVGDDLHAKRVLSLANAVTGALNAASLSIHAIGQGLAQARDLNAKHAIKQVDRLLSNGGVDVWDLFQDWCGHVIGTRPEIVVALDWTEYDHDDQATIALNLVTTHGRATPLVWKTVRKSDLAGRRNEFEDDVLHRFAEIVPPKTRVT